MQARALGVLHGAVILRLAIIALESVRDRLVYVLDCAVEKGEGEEERRVRARERCVSTCTAAATKYRCKTD